MAFILHRLTGDSPHRHGARPAVSTAAFIPRSRVQERLTTVADE